MPIYEYKCFKCTKKNKENVIFEITQRMNDDHSQAECPICGTISTTRIFTPFALHEGLSQAEKSAGTTKHRADLGKFMKDSRDKRKRTAEPGTKDAISNELWTGSEVQRGVIKGPENPT